MYETDSVGPQYLNKLSTTQFRSRIKQEHMNGTMAVWNKHTNKQMSTRNKHKVQIAYKAL